MRRLEAMVTYTDDEINRLARGAGVADARTMRKVPTIKTMRMRMAMAILSCVIYGSFPDDMSPGNMCHSGTDLLTGKYVRPTVSLGIVAGEGISCDRSLATSRRGKASQRQVTEEGQELSLGKRLNGRQNIGQVNNARGSGAVGNGGAQNRVQNENGVVLDIEQLLFIAGGQDNADNEDVDEPSVQDLALNVDNVFQADECDAFDYDVDEAPNAQTMFMENLSFADPVYDEAGLSYDSDILTEVHEHDNYQDAVCKLHEVHEMHENVQLNCVVDLDADYTSDSNMILYDQHVKDNAKPFVQNNVSSVPNDASMMIINEMHEQTA
uniref:Retrovirus-related Pol polyprotein from transposon TNT 1-94 n=1 Tax=Tanacetum cinerariifolium TaxID=118510 RepID=A0A6L2NZ60_TANCI|nr:hypothetical protein [Tanacetum cinerariifolium]